MNRQVLERLRNLIQPLELPDPQRADTFNEALRTFRELVDSVIAAEEAGIRTQSDLEVVLGMYGDLLVERAELERDGGVPRKES